MTDIDTMIDEELDAASDAVSSERAGYGNIQKLPDGDHTFQGEQIGSTIDLQAPGKTHPGHLEQVARDLPT